MIDIKPFQIFNVLDRTDFAKVQEDKAKFFYNNVPPQKRILENPGDNSGEFYIRLNFKHSPEKIGVFSKLCNKIQNILVEKGFEDPLVSRLGYLNHYERPYMSYHRHVPVMWENYGLETEIKDRLGKSRFAIPLQYFWIAIYYPHELYDKHYQGYVNVKLSKYDKKSYKFPSAPNSLVLHNGLYGHEVFLDKVGKDKMRDSCFTEWLCKYN